MPILLNLVTAWPDKDFNTALKTALEALDKSQLPLQRGLQHGSHVGPSAFRVVPLSARELANRIEARVSVFFTSIVAGCSCADDPSPVEELNEHCEMLVSVDRATGHADIQLVE